MSICLYAGRKAFKCFGWQKKNVNWKAVFVIVVTFDVDIYFNCIHSYCFVKSLSEIIVFYK